MREATKWPILTVALAFAGTLAVLTASGTAVLVVRRGESVRIDGTADGDRGIAAVVYVDGREKHLRRLLAEPKDYQRAA